jgi:hypothetical protein
MDLAASAAPQSDTAGWITFEEFDELRVSPERHGSGHVHATSSPPVLQPDNHISRSFTARRTSMNACEANVVEALLHAGATRTTSRDAEGSA